MCITSQNVSSAFLKVFYLQNVNYYEIMINQYESISNASPVKLTGFEFWLYCIEGAICKM